MRKSMLWGCGMLAGVAVLAASGCKSEQARVEFSYIVEPVKGLPPGMNTIYVDNAECGPNTDPRWSDLTATVLRNLIQESRDSFGTQVAVTDRSDTKGTFEEGDLAASGMSTQQGGAPPQLMAADGRVLSKVNVKVDVQERKNQTLDITSIGGWGGHGAGGGGADMQTREVTGYQRTMTVQTEFKLLDNKNNRVWDLKAGTYTATDETAPASPIYGSSRGLGDLPAADQMIAGLVDQGAREFVSGLMACRINVSGVVASSGGEECANGVKMLRAGMYPESLASFRSALAKKSDDHRAAFGAGLACEAMGDGAGALSYYKQALMGSQDMQYASARARMEAYASRMRKK
ncbi:MAG: hypothetical protein IT449_04090 [Phycisphaerales bacterium]|nr:hypothetical protein [Phycisphaerales bacterium]